MWSVLGRGQNTLPRVKVDWKDQRFHGVISTNCNWNDFRTYPLSTQPSAQHGCVPGIFHHLMELLIATRPSGNCVCKQSFCEQ